MQSPYASLALLLVFSSGCAHLSSAKSCQTVVRPGQLKKLVQDNHVLVALQRANSNDDIDGDDDDGADKDTELDDLCNRFRDTLESRVKDFEIVKVMDSNVKRQVWETSRSAPTSTIGSILDKIGLNRHDKSIPPHYPEYVLYKANQTMAPVSGLRFMGEEKTADAVSDFVSVHLKRKRIGSYVYSIGTYDVIANQIMEQARALAPTTQSKFLMWLWVKVVGRFAAYIVQPSSSEFEAELVDIYLKTANKVYEKGSDFPAQQITRLEGMLEDSNNKIGESQKEKLNQRIHILKKFDEPVDVSPEELRSLYMKIGMNMLFIMLFVVLLPLVFLDAAEDEKDTVKEGNDKEENKMDETKIPDKPEDTSKDENEDNVRADTVAGKIDEDTLSAMTVLELKEICREKDVKVGGRKADLIERILEES